MKKKVQPFEQYIKPLKRPNYKQKKVHERRGSSFVTQGQVHDPMMKLTNEVMSLPAPLNLRGRLTNKKGSHAPRIDPNFNSLLNEKYAPYNGGSTERHQP